MLSLFLSALLALSPASAAAPKAVSTVAPASAAFATLAEDYWKAQMELFPLYATFLNYPGRHDRLDDPGALGRSNEIAAWRGLLARLDAVRLEELSEAERVSASVMRFELENRLEALSHALWQWNVDHIFGAQNWIPTVISLNQPMGSEADVDALVTRMKQLPAFFASHVSNLREGLRFGRVAAKVPTERLIAQLEVLLAQKPEKTPYAEAARRLPAHLRHRAAEVHAAVETHVFPAYRSYLSFLKDEYLGKTRDGGRIGLSSLPGGKDAYRFMIRYQTSKRLTPEEVHQLGLKEVESLLSEMREIAGRMGHTGDLRSFMESLRADPKNHFETREEIVKTAQSLVARLEEKLPVYFKTLPRTPLVVKPIEEYKEKDEVAGKYFPPSTDLTRPGVYYVNTYQPRTRARYSLPALTVHEGVPGHHLQIALAMERKELPAFRRHGESIAFIEGWALYSERLGQELGVYEDDLAKAGMLSFQLMRACRLVVDSGLHAFGWTREKAIQYMKDNTPMSEHEIVAEVDRYTVWPAQALAYKIGQKEIESLRDESRKRLGPAFDIRDFHDKVLANGAVPLSTLREIVLARTLNR